MDFLIFLALVVIALFLFFVADNIYHVFTVLKKIAEILDKEAGLPMTLPVESGEKKEKDES